MKNIPGMTLIPYFFGSAVVLIIFLTIYASGQSMLRESANDPQIGLAENAALMLESGTEPAAIIPENSVDIEKSLSPFMIIFDANGKPFLSSAVLDGAAPYPPSGVLAYAQKFGKNRLTWEPKTGVREAIVVRYFNGARSGFVMSGRSLRETEIRENTLLIETFVGGIISLMLIVLGIFVCHKVNKSKLEN